MHSIKRILIIASEIYISIDHDLNWDIIYILITFFSFSFFYDLTKLFLYKAYIILLYIIFIQSIRINLSSSEEQL